jgi:ribosome maturation factor RimP
MEQMATFLGEYASGMQRSFNDIFNRVGESIEQSSAMMKMMNNIMEKALLQNVDIKAQYISDDKTVQVFVRNKSSILLESLEMKLKIAEQDEFIATETFEQLPPAVEKIFLISMSKFLDYTQSNTYSVLLHFPSPGTHQILQACLDFQVTIIDQAKIEAVHETITYNEVEFQSHSGEIDVRCVRSLLPLSSYDPLLCSNQGYYILKLGGVTQKDPICLGIDPSVKSTDSCHVVVFTRNKDHAPICKNVANDIDRISSRMAPFH